MRSVAAGAGEVVMGFAGIEYMQDMTGTVCYSAGEGEEGRLEDIRDGKIYWVAKLKDGNCWMTQNLDLDLNRNKTLTTGNSDVLDSWTPTADTQVSASPGFGTTNVNVIASWDPAMGGAATYCNDGGVAGKCKQSGNSTISINDGHDAQGNYYSWAAATAGQAASLTSTTAGEPSTQSICPKGWRLPPNAGNGSYDALFTSYGTNQSGTTIYGSQDIRLAPLYFVYGGYVNGSSLYYAGSQGSYWSSIAAAASNAYYMSVGTIVLPSHFTNRYNGLSVRCVAR